MTRNIYDDPAFFDGYSRLSRSVHGLDGAPEWPALRALLPDLHGLNVLDLGCGYGWFSRWAAEHGAASVLGLDLSVRMLERATSSAAHPAITYRRADLETVELPADAFDLAYSSLAFHYLEHLDTLLRTLHRALVPGGRLVFSIEHPIYTAPRRPGFVVDADGHRSWPVDGYQREGPRVTDWLAPGVVKQHRTLGTLVNLLIASGFTLAHPDEWGPAPEQVDAQPALDEERDRPMMAIFAARR